MLTYVVFDIETRVDKELLAETLYGGELAPEEAYAKHCAELREKTGSDFVSIPFHVPISIAVASVDSSHRLIKVESLPAEDEQALVADFWRRRQAAMGACLVSFNGRGFDLPVLELQALSWGISIGGHLGPKFGARYRFQTDAHLDLQEFVSNNGAARMRGGLDVLLRLCGYRGKGAVRGRDVQALWEAGRLEEIHAYCRRDVAATYLLFLRVQVMRGQLPLAQAAEFAKPVVAELEAEGGNP